MHGAVWVGIDSRWPDAEQVTEQRVLERVYKP